MHKLTTLGVDAVFIPTKLYASGVSLVRFERSLMCLCIANLQLITFSWHDQQAPAQPLEMMQGTWSVLLSTRRVPMKHSYRWSSCRSHSAENHALISSGGWPRWAF